VGKSRYEIIPDQPSSKRYQIIEPETPPSDMMKFAGGANLILNMLASNRPGKYQPPANIVQAGLRVIPKVGEDIVSEIPKALHAFQGGAAEAAGQPLSHPVRFGQNVGAGVAGLFHDVVNIPPNIPRILAHYGLVSPEGGEKASAAASKYWNVPNLYQPIPKEQMTPGDTLIQGAIRNLPQIYPAGRAIAGAGKAAIGAGTRQFSRGNPVSRAEIGLLESQLENKNLSLEEVEKLHQAQLDTEKGVKAQSTTEVGKAEPNRMKYDITQKQKNIEESNQELSGLNKQLEEHRNLPELPEIGENHLENVKNAEQKLQESQNHVEKVKNTHEKIKDLAEEAENKISEHLDEGAAHHVKVGRIIKQEVKNIDEGWSARYKKFKTKLADTKFQMPNVSQYAFDKQKILEQIKAGKGGNLKFPEQEAENPELQAIIDKAPTAKDASASDFMTKYQDFRDARYNARQRMKTEESATKRQQLADAIKDSEELEKTVKQTLTKGLGEHKEEFEKINNGYSTQVYPLRENSIANASKKKLSPNNLAEQLASDEPGTDIIRDIVKKNPEALKHVVGQRYEKGKKNFYKRNDILDEYRQQMPELQQLIDHRQNSQRLVKQSASDIEQANLRHNEIKNEHDKTVKSAKATETEKTGIEAEKVSRETKRQKLETQIADKKKEISEHEESVKNFQKHIDTLEKESKKSSVTLQQMMKIQREIKKTKIQLSKAKKNVTESRGNLVKLYYIGKGVLKVIGKIGKGI